MYIKLKETISRLLLGMDSAPVAPVTGVWGYKPGGYKAPRDQVEAAYSHTMSNYF